MTFTVPTISIIRAGLTAMTYAEIQQLSKLSGVPFTTLLKIRDGVTRNPGIETVRLFLSHMPQLNEAPADQADVFVGPVAKAPQAEDARGLSRHA